LYGHSLTRAATGAARSLMLDRNGYLKIVDFGFAKKLHKSELTYTLCGTPDYLVRCG
jgi:hypothetical protein